MRRHKKPALCVPTAVPTLTSTPITTKTVAVTTKTAPAGTRTPYGQVLGVFVEPESGGPNPVSLPSTGMGTSTGPESRSDSWGLVILSLGAGVAMAAWLLRRMRRADL
jgi:hypothetical protein